VRRGLLAGWPRQGNQRASVGRGEKKGGEYESRGAASTSQKRKVRTWKKKGIGPKKNIWGGWKGGVDSFCSGEKFCEGRKGEKNKKT